MNPADVTVKPGDLDQPEIGTRSMVTGIDCRDCTLTVNAGIRTQHYIARWFADRILDRLVADMVVRSPDAIQSFSLWLLYDFLAKGPTTPDDGTQAAAARMVARYIDERIEPYFMETDWNGWLLATAPTDGNTH